MIDASVYVILDRTAAARRDLGAVLEGAIAGGCRIVQLREKTWPSGTLLPLARRLRARCREAGVAFIVNDRIDLALAVDADGVHLGQDDLPPDAARPLLRPGMLMGLSTHDVAQARAAQERGGDYIAVGSVFPTGSKPDFTLVGPDLIRKLRPQIRVPLIGIGGITAANAGDVVRAGADGVAVISAVCAAPDPARATRELLDAVQQARRAT